MSVWIITLPYALHCTVNTIYNTMVMSKHHICRISGNWRIRKTRDMGCLLYERVSTQPEVAVAEDPAVSAITLGSPTRIILLTSGGLHQGIIAGMGLP
jgi:hypothetical protein